MSAPLRLRDDFDAPTLRHLARGSVNADQTRRLLALAVIYDGGLRSDAAAVGGVTVQVIRDWVLRFNAKGPEGLIDLKKAGRRKKLDDSQRALLIDRVARGPYPSPVSFGGRRCALAPEGSCGLDIV